MTPGSWITNMHNPLNKSLMRPSNYGELLEMACVNVIGPPRATENHTQEELEEIGLIGIYAP